MPAATDVSRWDPMWTLTNRASNAGAASELMRQQADRPFAEVRLRAGQVDEVRRVDGHGTDVPGQRAARGRPATRPAARRVDARRSGCRRRSAAPWRRWSWARSTAFAMPFARGRWAPRRRPSGSTGASYDARAMDHDLLTALRALADPTRLRLAGRLAGRAGDRVGPGRRAGTVRRDGAAPAGQARGRRPGRRDRRRSRRQVRPPARGHRSARATRWPPSNPTPTRTRVRASGRPARPCPPMSRASCAGSSRPIGSRRSRPRSPSDSSCSATCATGASPRIARTRRRKSTSDWRSSTPTSRRCVATWSTRGC